MNNVQNQTRKVLEEMLASSNLDAIKATLRGQHNFQNSLAPFASSWKASRYSSVTLSLGEECTANDSVDSFLFRLIDYQFKLPGYFSRISDPNCYKGPCDLQFNLGIKQWWILDGEDFPKPVGQSWPCHIQLNDYRLTLYYRPFRANTALLRNVCVSPLWEDKVADNIITR